MLKRMLFMAGALLLARAPDALAQQREITGTVVSAEANQPLAGASVTLAGTTRGTQTDPQGGFTLSVPAGAVRLQVSHPGYVAQTVTVPAGEATIGVRLAEDVLNLEGIVVTGQATTVARRNLANAVATVTAEELDRTPSESVEKALQGKIVGANISTNSGAPGGGVQVNLRGISSINGASEPLYVIDGVVVSNVAIPSGANAVTRASGGSNASNQDAPVNRIADLNPEDIASIEVLKGPSTAAIYGSKASNGVIIITTKSGQRGAPQISLQQSFGYFDLANTLGTREFTRDEAIAAGFVDEENADQFFSPDGAPISRIDPEEELAGRNDLSTETSLSVTGGTEDTRYFASGLVQNDEGIIENTGFQKQSFRLNLDQQLGDRVEVGFNTNLLHTLAQRGLSNNDNSGTSYYIALSSTPGFVDLRPRDGVFPINPFAFSNPLQTAALSQNDEDVWRFITSGNVSVDAFSSDRQSLRVLLNGGADYFQQENELFFPPELQFESPGFDQDDFRGTSLLSNSDNLNLNGSANLVHTWNPGNFTATTSGGIQYEDRDLNIARTIGRNLVGGQRNIDAATSIEVFEQRNRVQDLGIYVQEELLALDDNLLLTAGLRADRSSNTGDPDEYFLYPKAAASYVFESPVSRVDQFKVRVAYGETGNQPLFGQKFTPLSATNNIQGLPGLVVLGTAGDPDITPERSREVEGGFDAVLFGGNAELSFTAYQQNITDLLLTRTPAPSTGFASQIFNGGELRTRGIEASLQATPIRSDRFSWFTRTTFYTTESIIEDLPEDVPPFLTGGFGVALGAFRIEEGESATQIVARVIEDGEVRVEKVGDATPDFNMAFINDFTVGAFSLSSLWDLQQGNEVINLTKLLFDFGQVTADFDADPQPGVDPQTGEPILDGDGNQITTTRGERRLIGFGRETRPYIEDGGFLKLREIALAYNIPDRFLSRLGGVRDAQIRLSGRNLITITDYSGLNPEVSNFGNQPIARSIDVGPFPPSRSFWLTLNVGF